MKIKLSASLNHTIDRLEEKGFKTSLEIQYSGRRLDNEYCVELTTAEELVNLVNEVCNITDLPYVLDGETIVIVNDWI